MQLTPAPMSTDIKVITTVMLVVFVAVFIASLYYTLLFLVTAIVGVTTVICYLYTPVAYDVSHGNLTIVFHVGRKKCGKILEYSQWHGRIPMTLRVWGNGGLFAGSGLFWNKTFGFFRAYVTSSKTRYLVVVESDIGKVVVSPKHPGEFLHAAGSGAD